MSLTLTLANAVSGLKASQKNMEIITQNISNANTDGYTRKIVNQSALYINGQGTGVNIDGVTRRVDDYLLKAVRYYTSLESRTEAIKNYYDQAQIFFGEPGTENSLNAFIDGFFNSMQDLADFPESASIRQSAVNSGMTLARETSELARSLESLRFQADQEINNSIKDINSLIDRLYNVNIGIARGQSSGFPDVGLLDERDKILEDLSRYMNINVQFTEIGQAYVSTGNGTPIVDVDRFKFIYYPATSVDSFIGDASLSPVRVYAIDENGVPISAPQELVSSGYEDTVTTTLRSGKLKGLLEVRDVELPAILAQLDELAATLRDQINIIHNDGAGFPAASELTGTRLINPTDYTDWQGQVRMAVLDTTGRPLANQFNNENGGFRGMTLDIGNLDVGNGPGRLDYQTVIDEINWHFYLGPQQQKVRIQNLNDIKLVALDDNVPANAAGTFDFDFEMENVTDQYCDVVITGVAVVNGVLNTPAAFPTAPAVRVDPGDKFRTGAGGLALNITGAASPITVSVTVQVTAEDGSISEAIVDYTVDTAIAGIKNNRFAADLNTLVTGAATETSPDASVRYMRASLVDEDGVEIPVQNNAYVSSGYLKLDTDNTDFVLAIDEMNSYENGKLDNSPPLVGTGRGFSNYFELNNFFVTNKDSLTNEDRLSGSAVNMRVRADIIANPSLISTGELVISHQPAPLTDKPVYTYELGASGNQIVSRLVALGVGNVTFDAAGSLPTTTKTMASYASDIIGATASRTVLAESTYGKDKLLADGFRSRSDAISGVNVDEELANTIIFQNSYAASARIVKVTDEMFEALLGSV